MSTDQRPELTARQVTWPAERESRTDDEGGRGPALVAVRCDAEVV